MMQSITFEEELRRHGNLVYTSVGRSMLPLLRQGRDLVEIKRKDPDTRCKKYDAILYKRGDRYILHRIIKVTDNGYIIAGDHNYIKEYDITDKQILGILTGVVRNGKRIDANNKCYLAYVHLWCDLFPIRALILRIGGLLMGLFRKIRSVVNKCRPRHTTYI
jgi:hypothetical protein